MSDETLKWKLFPFSLKGRAKNGIIEPYRRSREIGELYVLAFV
jgi:hypothetical protein